MSQYDEIKRLECELQTKKTLLHNKQANCHHQWEATKYDPETYKKASFSHYEPHCSDPEPIYNYYDAQKDRWSRYCPLCEKKEYTYTQKAVQYEPDFK